LRGLCRVAFPGDRRRFSTPRRRHAPESIARRRIGAPNESGRPVGAQTRPAITAPLDKKPDHGFA
jgi:hypothetical protein